MLLAPQVKFQGLVSDQQLAQILKIFPKPPWAPRSRVQPVTGEVSAQEPLADLSWSPVASPRRRCLGCVLGICPPWLCVGMGLAEALGHDELAAATAPQMGGGDLAAPISSQRDIGAQ